MEFWSRDSDFDASIHQVQYREFEVTSDTHYMIR
jgi:hypothetical protein